jgi:hypothetical protein
MKDDKMDEKCSTNGMRDAYKILVGKPREKIPFGRPKCRWKDNKIEL